MSRVKRGVNARARHKKVLGKAKGYYGARRKVFRVAKQAVTKAGQYAYRDRRVKKREFRALWIQRINAGARMCETLLESFPPQCGGASIPVGDFDVDLPLSSEAGVTWTDQIAYLEGEIVGGVFQPLR